MHKAIKITSIGEFGEYTLTHPLFECDYQDKIVIATLQGVIKAGHAIKSFELVEA